ncbi:MAG: hypothetical protein R6X02_33875 [Enhygromyxa sp.]
MTDARTFWQTLYERFDPEEPVTEPSWRAPREYSPAADILGRLGRSFGEKKYLFYGGVGTGKSTELLHIAEQRSVDSFVVVVDLDRHFSTVIGDPDALLSVQAWEVVLLIALGVLRATSEKLGHKWTRDELEPLRAAITAFTGEQGDSAKIDIMKLASSVTVFVGGAVAGPAAGAVVGKGIELLGKAVGASSWNLLLGRRRRVDDQDERAGALLAAVNDLLRHVATSYYGEVTVLVDGLDRLEDLEAIEALFVRSRLLSMLDVPTVMTGPIALFHRGIAKRIRGFVPNVIANIPVLAEAEPSAHGKGVPVCVNAYRLRTRDLDPAGTRFTDDGLAKLAYYSGGIMREFAHLIRRVAEKCWDRSLESVDDLAINTAIRARRLLYEEGLDEKAIALLRKVARDRSLPDDDSVPHLLRNWWLMPYPNRSVWWQPHPLLMISALAESDHS